MKAKICFWILFIVLFCCGCAEENEVPPYRKTSTEAYVMPKPVPLIQNGKNIRMQLKVNNFY